MIMEKAALTAFSCFIVLRSMWQRWLRYIRNFFGFSLGEARGFTILALLVLLAYVGWFVYRLLPTDTAYNPQADQQQLDSLISRLEAADTSAGAAANTRSAYAVDSLGERFAFNPNTLSYDSLLLLGFPPYLAKRLLNYRDKGGRFRKREDLQKLYGLDSGFYRQLEPWIQVPPQPKTKRQPAGQQPAYARKDYKSSEKPTSQKPLPFDLNQADSLQLIAVRGIGPVLSSRILKFREALGGFVKAEQVREVWGLPPETADYLLSLAFVAPEGAIRRLPINTTEVAELARHPYINYKQAQAIVRYREQHGNYRQAEDLLQIHSLDESFVNKLLPYLQF